MLAAFTIREGDQTGPLAVGARVELFVSQDDGRTKRSLDTATSDKDGRAMLLVALSPQEQSHGTLSIVISHNNRQQEYPLASFPRETVWAVYLSRASASASSASPPAADTFTNSLGMKLKLIPAGEFEMGSPANETQRDNNEPQHRVKITRPFYLGVHEVTQEEWKAVMGTTPWSSEDFVKEGADYAATFVSWEDAVKFCAALTKRERTARRLRPDQEYRLPTEAQWEYACRGGEPTAYSFGDDNAKLGDYAWYLVLQRPLLLSISPPSFGAAAFFVTELGDPVAHHPPVAPGDDFLFVPRS